MIYLNIVDPPDVCNERTVHSRELGLHLMDKILRKAGYDANIDAKMRYLPSGGICSTTDIVNKHDETVSMEQRQLMRRSMEKIFEYTDTMSTDKMIALNEAHRANGSPMILGVTHTYKGIPVLHTEGFADLVYPHLEMERNDAADPTMTLESTDIYNEE